jgi:hypothetical protein
MRETIVIELCMYIILLKPISTAYIINPSLSNTNIVAFQIVEAKV